MYKRASYVGKLKFISNCMGKKTWMVSMGEMCVGVICQSNKFTLKCVNTAIYWQYLLIFSGFSFPNKVKWRHAGMKCCKRVSTWCTEHTNKQFNEKYWRSQQGLLCISPPQTLTSFLSVSKVWHFFFYQYRAANIRLLPIRIQIYTVCIMYASKLPF